MRKTEEKTDAPPFINYTRERVLFFFSTEREQFLKLGLYTLNTMQSLFFLFTLLLFNKKHLTQTVVTLEKKLKILSSLCVVKRTCQKGVNNWPIARSDL